MAGDEESAFHQRADALLARLATVAEDGLGDDAEVELGGGILQIELDDQTYVVNKHAPTRQVWLSSPVSGAWHFAWNGERALWIDTRQGRDILPLLAEEWSAATRTKISFDC